MIWVENILFSDLGHHSKKTTVTSNIVAVLLVFILENT